VSWNDDPGEKNEIKTQLVFFNLFELFNINHIKKITSILKKFFFKFFLLI